MRKILFFVLALHSSLFTLHCIAQPAIQWEKCLGGSSDDESRYIYQTNDGGYIVSGISYSHDGNLDNSNHGSAWIVKLNSNGVIQWEKSYGDSVDDQPKSIIQTSDGGFIFTGNTGNSAMINFHGLEDVWVCKLNDTGGVQWSKCYGGSQSDYGESIVQTTDGGYILAGQTNSIDGDVSSNHGDYDAWVVKLNDTGAIQWSKCYGGFNGDAAFVIVKTLDGGYIFSANTLSTDGDVTGNLYSSSDAGWVVKLNNAGTIQWEKCYGGYNGGTNAYSILQTSEGGYLLGCNTFATNGDVSGNHGGTDYWVVKLTDTGDVQWQKCYGGSDEDIGNTVVQTTDGNYAMDGYSKSTDGQVTGNHGLDDYWVVKFDTNGTLLWEQSYGGILEEQAHYMIATNDNGLAITGVSTENSDDVTGYHGGQADYWVVKLNPDSMVGINEIKNKGNIVVYPNPVSSTLTIRNLSPAGAGRNEIEITDVFGRTVYSQLITHNSSLITQIDVSGFSNGIYYWRIISGNEVPPNGKIVVLK